MLTTYVTAKELAEISNILSAFQSVIDANRDNSETCIDIASIKVSVFDCDGENLGYVSISPDESAPVFYIKT